MLRATWKLRLMAVVAVGLIQRSVHGQEVSRGINLDDHATGVLTTISTALKGGEAGADAQNELIQMAAMATFFLALLYISFMIASAVGKFFGGIITKKVDATLGKFSTKAIRNLIMLVVAMIALDKWGLNVTGLAAVLAAAGFAVGMALQGTLQNFAAGVMLLFFRPFKVDDYICVAGTEGTVEEIDLFTTRLNALDNRHLIIPNGEIFGAKLENYTRNALRRVDVNVGTGYNADLGETRSALERAANAVNKSFTESAGHINVPEPQIYLMNLGGSSVDWQLRVWCRPEDYWGVREALTGAAKESLDHSGISIPFPQMDVHVVGKALARAAAA